MADDVDIGISVHSDGSGQQLVDRLRDSIAGVRKELENVVAASGIAHQSMTTDFQAINSSINVTIGAFQQMGKTIDATNVEAVAAFREEGDALAVYLARLGATDEELNKIGASVASLEARSGAAKILPNLGAQVDQIDKVPVGARRAASALTTLSFAAATGGGSFRGMAIGLGSAVTGLAQLTSSARLAAAATGIGALVTVLATIITLLDGAADKSEKASKAMNNLGNLNVNQLSTLQKATEAQFKAAEDRVNQFSRLGLAFTKSGIKASEELDRLAKKRETLSDAVVEAQKKESHDVFEIQKKATEDATVLATKRAQGEFAARRVAVEQEFKDAVTDLNKLTVGQKQKDDALIALRKERDAKLAEIDKDQSDKVREALLKTNDEALEAAAKAGDDQVNAERLAVERVFAERLKDIQRMGVNEQQKTDLIASAAEARSAKIKEINTKERKDLDHELAEARAQIAEATGQQFDAQGQKIEEKYKETIKRLQRVGDTEGVKVINHLIDLEKAKARIEQLGDIVSTATSTLQTTIAGIQAQAGANLINDKDARGQLVTAYTKARDIIAATLPELREQAEILHDPKAAQQVAVLTEQLLEMNIAIKQNSDDLLKLKEGAKDAVQGGLETLFNDLGQGGEAAANAWKDAARSIVDSLRQIAAQMLATLIIQNSLKLFGFSGGGSVSASPSKLLSGDVLPGVHAAGGGAIRGPGTSTSDSIPAWLSDGEYVINARAVREVGTGLLDAINAVGPGVGASVRRPRVRGYAEGGMVASTSNDRAIDNRLTVGLEDGLVVRHLESTEGTAAQIKFIERNKNAIRRALGVG